MARTNDFIKSVDKIIGARIQELRLSMGLSRGQLASRVDVTHQQLGKYEKGDNRLSPGRLIAIARALGKELDYFTDGIDTAHKPVPTLHQRMSMEVSRNFMKLTPASQLAVNTLVRTLAGGA